MNNIEIKKTNNTYSISIPIDIFNLLLKIARTNQIGRRGLSSKKSRIRKKIVTTEINNIILNAIKNYETI